MTGRGYDPANVRAIGRSPQRNRRSTRLQGYVYSMAGAYFVILCTQNRECLFGNIVNGEMRLNDAGRIVADEWLKIAEIRAEIELDEWVVMPNHVHGIVVITGTVGAGFKPAPTGIRESIAEYNVEAWMV